MATLGELYDTAGEHLRAAAEALPTWADPAYRSASAQQLERVIVRMRDRLEAGAEEVQSPVEADLAAQLGRACGALRTARRLLSAEEGGKPRPNELSGAGQAVAAVRDLVESHRGPDRVPVTAYAYLLGTRAARAYITRRTAELAWEAGRVAQALSSGVRDPGVEAAFAEARSCLDQGSVFGRTGTRDADEGIAAFPFALPVEPVQALASDPLRELTVRLGEDCERLGRVAFETLHERSDHRLSGSDLQQMARWTAMARLLSGRVLLRIAEGHADAAVTSALKESAGVLRGSAQAWQQAAAAWHRVVDLADPRAHPRLPPPSYKIVRQGKVVRLPRITPHPGAVVSHTVVVRVGQLLFGAHWQPGEQPGEPRSRTAILADARGEGPLVAALYRLPASGWQLAMAAPLAVRRAQGALVTDSVDHRPQRLPGEMRFHSVHPRQVENLIGAYAPVMTAEHAAAGALLNLAKYARTDVPRALLDADAHRLLAEQQGWARQRQENGPTARQRRVEAERVQPPVRRPRGSRW
ncbi:hypothetical protein PUR34_14245 [Streptomyces sp. JV185]|uniref:hypothetical protein n=1 Tax=Streptomyces sp. JV185 TaxID=858638 RepID=UPI002E77BD45|nr:hypothetical protein [Streptomyces sp. JV185]MEE1769280.1 hypothetical protein [Streptomyces sp. JV185]